ASDPAKAELVLHLRSAPTPGPDIATSVLPSSQPIGENSWHLFSFPPIPDSQDKAYYIEVESPNGTGTNGLTLYWWRSDPAAPTDAYPHGTAYIGGKPQQGDLAFGLRYDASPMSAWAQVGRAVSANFPPLLMALLAITVLVGVVLAFVRLPAILRDRVRLRRFLTRWSLPIVLAVALANGLVYLFLVPPWQGPDEHGHFMYAALLDRHGLNNTEVQAIEWFEGGKDREEIVDLKSAVYASMMRNDWTYFLNGYVAPGSPDPPLGSDVVYTEFIWQLRQPPTYYWLSAATFGLVRTLGVPVDVQANPEGALMLMRGVSLALSLGVVALAWLAGALLSAGRQPWLRLMLPLTITLLPMHAFIASSADNDILAELAVSALFVSLIALLRRPCGWRGLALAGLVVLLTATCMVTKSTALVAGAPLAGLGLAVWLGILYTRLVNARFSRKRRAGRITRKRGLATGLALVGLFLVLCMGVGALALQPDGTAAGWQLAWGSGSYRAPRMASPGAPDGSSAIQLGPNNIAYQWVDLPLPHPPLTMTFSLWAKQLEANAGEPPSVSLVVDQRGRLPRIGAETLTSVEITRTLAPAPADSWTRYAMTVPVRFDDRKVMVQLHAGGAATDFDDLALSATGKEPESLSPPRDVYLPLFNGSAEVEAWRLHPLLARVLPGEQEDTIDALVSPQAYDKLSVWRRYAYRQFRSFWGNFGWLSLPLPEVIYSIINAIILAALAGLAWLGIRRAGRWSGREWLGVISLTSLVVAAILGFAKQMAPMSTSGVHTDPHGRYLFVLMLPIAWLLLVGLSSAWSLVSRMLAQGLAISKALPMSTRRQQAASSLPWGIWLWTAGLVLLVAYSIVSLITPYFYG
ncbi:MAG TPA: DUF2142 domain-containing protein, partial [Chloroflexia bacterium]|nr:DUF2142 domain-containing protein [Chloroflexia bacterium]